MQTTRHAYLEAYFEMTSEDTIRTPPHLNESSSKNGEWFPSFHHQ